MSNFDALKTYGSVFSVKNAGVAKASISVTTRCPHCKAMLRYVKKDGRPEKCSECEKLLEDPVELVNYPSEKAKLSTHIQVKTFCNDCHHRAIFWVRKKVKSVPCPNCGENGWKVSVTKMNPKGNCETVPLWGHGSAILPPPRLKKKTSVCNDCGYVILFLTRRPAKCKRCGSRNSTA